MADSRSHPEEDDGAKPSELLIEAARRNNTDLLQEVIDNAGGPDKAAILLNETKTVMGNYIYHEAALRGNYEIIDTLLDQEGFECDPISRIEGDTPLHSAIRYINSLPINSETTTFSSELLNMMIEAGSDPRIKNKAQLTPFALTDPRNTAVRNLLQDALDVMLNQGDFIQDEGRVGNGDGGVEDDEEGSDYAGSASDSDFDPEEYKREREKRKANKESANGGMI